MNKLIVFCLLPLSLCYNLMAMPISDSERATSSSSDSLYNKYKTHILTLDYISRKTNNNTFFLNQAEQYCDSLMITGKDSAWAHAFKEKIELTLGSCEDNLNHRIQLFPYFNGPPPYMGFADDVIEYAYDQSLEELFATPFKKLHNGPLSKVNISSIITRGNCDDEMFEIVKQTIMGNTSHHVITTEKLNELLGNQKAFELTNGIKDTTSLSLICKALNLENLGVFHVTNLDNIEDDICLVNSEFSVYSPNIGFTEAVFCRGFSQDKRGVLGINLLLLFLESILLIALIAVFEEKIIKFIRTRKLFSAKEMFFQFVKKVKFVSICFATPTLLSFVMIYSLSFLTPDPTDHYMESGSFLWVIALTLGMSIIPTFINLFLINRLQIDGFHNIRGYRTFANASLYATYLPLFIFYIIQFEHYPRTAHILLVVLTFVIGDLIARSYFQFTSKSKHRNLKTQAVAGLFVGIIALIFFNTYALTEISPSVFLSSLVFIAPISLIHLGIGKYMDKVNEKKLESSTEKTLLSDLKFIKDVIDPKKDIYDLINNNISEDNLNLMIINAPMGIGKTRSLEEAKTIFTNKDNNWNWYYGDCDEIQDENAISFEPFIEAFKKLLKFEEFTDRTKHLEDLSGDAVKTIAGISGAGSDMIGELKRDENRSMTEICVEIADKLEANKNKTVFVMEDLHWIDPESYAFLKHFIKTVNRNEFIRGNLCIVLTLRNDQASNYRGVDYNKLMGDLKDLDKQLESKTIIEDLLTEKQFNVKDFILHISNQNKQFKILDDSLAEINYKLNSALSENNDKSTITPLYILKVIEQWIQNNTLQYTPDGYVLTCSIDSLELPNTDEIDAYYHSILNDFDKKWTRILESAAIIGNKFDANILSQVWGYELLEILDFFETAEEKGLITDVSDEDNIYEFKDKRIISAIKSYFPSSHDTGVKQIIIEYNKRYLEIQKSIIENPSEYSIEEVLSVVRRLTLMMSNPNYNELAKRLIVEIIVRLIADEEHEKIDAFTDFLKTREIHKLAELISMINVVANLDTSFKNVTQKGDEILKKSYPKGSVEQELRIFGLMLKEKRFSSEYANIKETFINKQELSFIEEKINNTYKGITLISMGFLYLNSVELNFTEKLFFLDDLNEKLKSSSDHSRLCLYLEHLKLSLQLNEQIDNNELEQSSGLLLEKAISTNDLRLIKICLKLKIEIVTRFLNNKESGVLVYKKNINKLRPNNTINIHWVSCVLYFYYLGSGAIYCKENPEEAQKDLELCEDFIYKRNETNDWTKLIEAWFKAKQSLLTKTKQHDELKQVCDIHMDLLIANNLTNTTHYATACYEYSEYFKLIKDYDKLIEYRLLQIKTLEDLYKDKSKTWALKIAYSNTSAYYRLYFKDVDNTLKYALLALEVVNNSKGIPEHSIAATYTTVVKAYIQIKDNKTAIKYAFHYLDLIEKSKNCVDINLATAFNLVARSYQWSNQYQEAIEYFDHAISHWKEKTNKQNLKRSLATINKGLCQSEVIIKNNGSVKAEAKKTISTFENGLKDIKDPKLEALLTETNKKLIIEAEERLLSLKKNDGLG